ESVAQLSGKNSQTFFRYSKEGSLDPEYDWDMQNFGVIVYLNEAQPLLNDLLQYKQRQLDKVGALRER
ncbi:MAG: hypothetical protein J7559_05185, partial [Cohnella sp.]|nr:hypothetical protein [Cohnella sp.]